MLLKTNKMKTVILIAQLLIVTTLFGKEDTTNIWIGDEITFTNGETKRVNVQKLKKSKVVYTEFGDDMHVVHKVDREQIKSVEWDGVVQLKELGYYQNYRVVNNTEDQVQRSLRNGKQLLAAGFINGAVGIVAGTLAISGKGNADGVGFVISVFGSRSWLPLLAAGGSNYRKTKKRCLVRMDE
jgi:hypothetical protein